MSKYVIDGFIIIKNLISADEARTLANAVSRTINKYALELDVTVEQYMYCTGRWAGLSIMTALIPDNLRQRIASKVEQVIQQKVVLEKQNIIAKSSYIKDEVAFHQDISYSYNSPYNLSVWLSLNDVDGSNGPLQVITNSHKWPVESAVDFWSPSFIDQIRQQHQSNIIEILLNAGDAIIFDVRLWHGSKLKTSDDDRFAYVTRWSTEQPIHEHIPPPKSADFGMWNCDKLTNDLLRDNIHLISDKRTLPSKIDSIKLLELYCDNAHIGRLPAAACKDIVMQDLNNLIILKQACSKHNAGDLAGKIYKNLWNSLLQYLPTKNI